MREKGELPGARQTGLEPLADEGQVEGRHEAPPPRCSRPPLFLGPLLSIVGCGSPTTPSTEKQIGFLQAKPACVPGAAAWERVHCQRDMTQVNYQISGLADSITSQRAGAGNRHRHPSPVSFLPGWQGLHSAAHSCTHTRTQMTAASIYQALSEMLRKAHISYGAC